MKTDPREPGDWFLRASVLEALSVDAGTLIAESSALRRQAQEIRAKYSDYEYLFED